LAGIIAEGFGIVKGIARGVADNVPVFKSMITHLTKNDANEAFDRFNSPKSVTSIDNEVPKTAEEYALKRTGEKYGHVSLEKERQRLPVFKYRDAILYLVETHSTSIIVGETGSGKTTQIPQYLKEAGWADGGRVIACTQPRRLAVQVLTAKLLFA
ncbi:probable pre-mRNA-splicing factor ATP-dependent RNA helicase DEAH9 isoform X1, partial [Tanacetum coccineum]